MRECEYYEELISRLVDSELNKSEYDALWLHIKDCSRCNAMYAVFNAMSDIISDEAEPLPEGLHENIMAGVRRSVIVKQNRRLTISKPVRSALAAVACAAFVLFAARGLAPTERAKGIAVTNMEAASFDASAEENVKNAGTGKAGKAAEPAQTESPVEAEVPAEAPAQAAPTVDIYLSDFGSEAEAPAESSPAPAQMPLVNLTPQVTAAPAPVVQLTPVPADNPENTETVSDAEPAQNIIAESFADSAPAEAEVPAETEVQAEAPAIPTAALALPEAPVSENTEAMEVDSSHSILGRTFMSLFVSAPAPKGAEDVGTVQEPEPSADSAGEAAEPASEVEKDGDKKKNDKSIKATISEKKAVNDLLDLLSGKEEKLPEAEPEKVYKVKIQIKDRAADRNLKVLFFGEEIFYVDNDTAEVGKIYKAKCSVKEFETFIKEFEDKLPEPAEETAAPESSDAPAEKNGEKQAEAAVQSPEPTVDPFLSTPAPDLSDIR